jgi:phosphonate transport system ATP-binding protein
MDQLKKFSKEMQITLIVNLHQVNVALKYSDRIIGVNKGRIVFDGAPGDLSTEQISEIYGTESRVMMAELREQYAA